MKNDLNYIIKRIIVGVVIGLILFNVKKCDVHAETVIQSFPYTGTPIRCRAYNGSSWSNGTIQQYTERGTYQTNWCKANGFNPSQVFFPYSQINTEIGKTYNVSFTVFSTPLSPNPGGEITKDDLSSIVWNMSTSVGYASDVPCDYTVGQYIFYDDGNGNIYYGYQYNVVCKKVSVNPTYGSFNIKFYQNYKVSTSITRTLMFEEIQTTDDLLTNSDTTNAQNSFNDFTLTQNSIIGNILYIPIYFYTGIKSKLHNDSDTCNTISFSKNQLPLNSFINYDNDGITLPCFRNLIEQDLGFTYYETIGVVAGGCLILVYVVHRGRGLVRMSNAQHNDEDLWGGLS